MDDDTIDPQFMMQNSAVDPLAFPDMFDNYHDLGLNAVSKTDDDDEEMEDLFGDDTVAAQGQSASNLAASASATASNADESGEEREQSQTPARSAHDTDDLSASERQHRKNLEYEEDENPEDAVVELKHAVLSIPNLPMPNSSDGQNWVIKLPNFVKLDPKPFHPDTYVGPEQSDDYASLSSVRERSMSIKLEVENTIRWKWTKDELGRDKRQSNSRIIRWTDGSLSLLLGKELFDISCAYDTGSSAARRIAGAGSSSFSQSQSQTPTMNSQSQQTSTQPQSQTGVTGANRGLTYLVAQHKRAGILQAEAPITGTMSLRPTGMQSETHRMLVRAVGQKHSKVARLRFAPDSMSEAAERERAANEAGEKKGRRKRGSGEGAARRKRNYGRRRGGDSVWSDEEADGHFDHSDEENDDSRYGRRYGQRTGSPHKSQKQAKDQIANARKGPGEYVPDDFLVDDSSEGDADADGDDEDAEGDLDIDAEGEGSESASRKRKSKKSKSSPSSKRRHKGDEGEGGTEDLDALDARIARQEDEERKKRNKAYPEGDEGGAGASDAAMDVESEDAETITGGQRINNEEEGEEDEEEDFHVRRAGRRKRAITLDEEDE